MKRAVRKPPRRRGVKPAARQAKKAMRAKKTVQAVPAGFRTVTPQLTFNGADRAIDFYTRAFGAKELMRMPGPQGKIMHAELRIGDSVIFVSDEYSEMGEPYPRSPQSLGGTTGPLHLYVPDVDAAVKRAVDAGARVRTPVADMFWGDRYGQVIDPFGYFWGLATHKEDLTPAEVRKRQEAFFARGASS